MFDRRVTGFFSQIPGDTGAGLGRSKLDPWMHRARRLHFVGIGGAGMGGIAEVLHNLGFSVSGSDQTSGPMTQRLSKLGLNVSIGHASEAVDGADVVVVSTAVDDANPEILAARELGVPVVPRAQMLAELMRFRLGVAIAGTHGKTTTTSLVASLLAEGGLDPTYVVGGRLNSSGTNARLGEGSYLVAEADESDASFLLLQPMVSVVTNIDAAHMETYGGNFDRLKRAFADFLQRLPFYGLAVACHDDPTVLEVLEQANKSFVTYGTHPQATYRATDISQDGLQMRFTLSRAGKDERVAVILNLPGEHNVLNALGAIAVASELGIEDEDILTGLATFGGIGRRLQSYGELRTPAGAITLIDDYGHHPTEVAATLNAVRGAWPGRRLVAAFQPHRYTRTRDLFEDFTQVLCDVDALVLLDIYAAGEVPIAGADGRTLSRAIRSRGKVDPVFCENVETLGEVLEGVLHEGDVLLTLGAGNVGAVPGLLQARWEGC